MRRCQALAWTHSIEARSLTARQQAALVGPVERQIEFGKTCRGEFDRLPAVQDRLDQLGAQDPSSGRVFSRQTYATARSFFSAIPKRSSVPTFDVITLQSNQSMMRFCSDRSSHTNQA